MSVVRLEIRDAVGHIVLDRPPANSYDKAFLDDLDAAIDEARFDLSVKALLVRSASEKFFVGGADIKMFATTTTAFQAAFVIHANEVFAKIEHTPKVSVAAINGHCLGGGLELALCCDFRVAAEGSYGIGLVEANLALLPGTGGTQRLPRLIGRQKALDLMLRGAAVPPGEAKALGIVDDVVPAEQLATAAHERAAKFASGATLAYGQIKLATVLGLGMELPAGLEYEHAAVSRLFASADAHEGATAFVEKRKPTYKGE